MARFVQGRVLAEAYFSECVGPILAERFPGIAYSCALIGPGSDVLGFDTPMSRDHDWGPRAVLFLSPSDLVRNGALIDEYLSVRLPTKFRGYPTAFTTTADAHAVSKHRIKITSAHSYLLEILNFDLDHHIEPRDWLTFPEQLLRSIQQAKIFHDDVELQTQLKRFQYYPHDVWLFLMACGWARIGQEEHLVGRAGMLPDELGASLIASRLVRDLMRLCFLMERVYAPYPKWFGTAFDHLSCASPLKPLLTKIQHSRSWRSRDRALVAAYEFVANKQNELGLTGRRPTTVRPFHDRPFSTIEFSCGFSSALFAEITDPSMRKIAEGRPIGGIDQFSDSTDLISDNEVRLKLKSLYG